MKSGKDWFDDYVKDKKLLPAMTGGDDDPQPLVVNGVNYYLWADNGAHYPQSRILAMQDILTETTTYKLTAEDLTAYMEKINDLAVDVSLSTKTEPQDAAKSAATIQQICNTILNRLRINKALDKVIEISALWFIAEGENPTFPESSIQRAKVADFSSTPEHIGFFLRTGIEILNPWDSQWKDSFQNAMQELRETLHYELELMDNPNLWKSTRSEGTKKGQPDYWTSQREIVNGWIDFLDSQPTSSTSG